MRRFAALYLVPILLGSVWLQTLVAVHHDLARHAIQTHRHDGGTNTLQALSFNPPMIVWWITRIPEGDWQVTPLYTYYAILTLLLWNAGRDRRWRQVATAAYATHMAATFIATTVAGTLGLPYESVGSFDLSGDIAFLFRLTERHPGPVTRVALVLTIWHSFAIGRLVHSWTTVRLTGAALPQPALHTHTA